MKLMAIALTAAVAGSASAAFTGLQVVKTTFSGPSSATATANFDRYEVFAVFNGATDTVTNVGFFNRVSGTGNPFFHYDSNTLVSGANFMRNGTRGGWNPSLVNGGNPLNNGIAAMDSYVTIGGYVGVVDPSDPYEGVFANTSANDPSFATGWATGGAIPTGSNAGWFNGTITNNQGRVGVGPNSATQVKLGQFVVAAGADAGVWRLNVLWNNGVSTTSNNSGQQTFNLPAPGAVALLGLAGLAGRRRR